MTAYRWKNNAMLPIQTHFCKENLVIFMFLKEYCFTSLYVLFCTFFEILEHCDGECQYNKSNRNDTDTYL